MTLDDYQSCSLQANSFKVLISFFAISLLAQGNFSQVIKKSARKVLEKQKTVSVINSIGLATNTNSTITYSLCNKVDL